MEAFLNPSTIVIIGASTNTSKLGYVLARNIQTSGFTGQVHFVNPKGGTLFGKTLLRSLDEIPTGCDLAVLLLPSVAIPEALEGCGRKKVKAAIIASGGFRETGKEGTILEQRCLEIAQSHGMRLLGPNCVGVLSTTVPYNATFLSPPGPVPGSIAFLSQSGAMCAIATDWSRSGDMGFSWLISSGNELDVSVNDWFEALGQDRNTSVLALYLESIRDGDHFVHSARMVTRDKPIVALKVGRTASGITAAMSHTGALAGSDRIYDAAFDRAGIIRADTSEQLFAWSRVLDQCPPVHGNRIAILTNAGGPGVMAADVLTRNGLTLAELSEETQTRIGANLPKAATVQNPVDMLASATPDQYGYCLDALLRDESVDAVSVLLPPPPVSSAGALARAIIPVIQRHEKPVVVALLGGKLVQEAAEHLRAANIPVFWSPESGIEAIGVLEYRRNLIRRMNREAYRESRVSPEESGIRLNLTTHGAGYVQSDDLHAFLTKHDIPVVPTRLALSSAEAETTAIGLGLPVALKLEATGLTHKAQMGGVLLDRKSIGEVRDGFARLKATCEKNLGSDAFLGVLIQPMIEEGGELIMGAIRDRVFGSLVMFGTGGSDVESSADNTFELAPLSSIQAEECLMRTSIGRSIRARFSSHHFEEIVRILVSLGEIMASHPDIEELELNPVRFTRNEVVALDFRARLMSGTAVSATASVKE